MIGALRVKFNEFALFSAVLKNNEWKPLQKGYDFLKIMDWEKAEEKKKRLKNKGEHARADIKTEIGKSAMRQEKRG